MNAICLLLLFGYDPFTTRPDPFTTPFVKPAEVRPVPFDDPFRSGGASSAITPGTSAPIRSVGHMSRQSPAARRERSTFIGVGGAARVGNILQAGCSA